jgi:hypothetical protein
MRRTLVVLSLGLLGCLSPTMPLPPPSKPDIDGPDGSGRVVLSGRIPKANSVYVDNLSTGYSAGQALDPESGAYRFSIAASVGDRMSMFYRVGATDSEARLFAIPATKASAASNGGTGGGGESGTDAAGSGGEGAGAAGSPPGGTSN